MSHPIHDLALVLALFVLWVLPAVLIARLAGRKGRSFAAFLVAALVIPWPLVLLVVLLD